MDCWPHLGVSYILVSHTLRSELVTEDSSGNVACMDLSITLAEYSSQKLNMVRSCNVSDSLKSLTQLKFCILKLWIAAKYNIKLKLTKQCNLKQSLFTPEHSRCNKKGKGSLHCFVLLLKP